MALFWAQMRARKIHIRSNQGSVGRAKRYFSCWLKKIQNQFDETGIVSLENFVLPESMDNIKKESLSKLNHAYFNPQEHNVYLKSEDEMYSSEHPRNRKIKFKFIYVPIILLYVFLSVISFNFINKKTEY